MEKSKKNKSTPQILHTKTELYLLPLALVIGILPLIVRLKVVYLNDALYHLWNGKDVNPDFFSYYKGIFLIVVAICSVVIYLLTFNKKRAEQIKKQKKYYLLVLALLLGVILSSVFSAYPYLSISGAPDRYEGLYVWMAYLWMCIYAMSYERREKSDRILTYTIFAFVLLMGILGLSQYMDKDLFQSGWMQRIIIPSAYEKYRGSFTIADYGTKSIYGTAYHYNYMGSLAPMLFAFSFIMLLFHTDKKIKIMSAAASFIALFLLLGSSARSGIVAMAVFFVVMLLFFGRKIAANRKLWMRFAAVVLLIVVAVFVAGKQAMFYRLPLLASDMRSLLSSNLPRDHYRSQIDLKAVQIDGGDISIETSAYAIIYTPKEDRLWDVKNNKALSYRKEKETLWNLEDSYSNIWIRFFEDGNTADRYIQWDDGKIQLYFKQTKDALVATNPNGMEVRLEDAPAIGFVGQEKLGSARGYIWSRTLPLLSKAWIFGYGADSFLAVFPQGDIYAKQYAYDSLWMLVDKPHNGYLQIAVNFGLLSLLLFVLLLMSLAVGFFKKMRRFEVPWTNEDVFAIACFMAVIAYLGAAWFNDSVLSVAPIFWVLLGLSFTWIRPE